MIKKLLKTAKKVIFYTTIVPIILLSFLAGICSAFFAIPRIWWAKHICWLRFTDFFKESDKNDTGI